MPGPGIRPMEGPDADERGGMMRTPPARRERRRAWPWLVLAPGVAGIAIPILSPRDQDGFRNPGVWDQDVCSAIAANCEPCVQAHFDRVRQLGVSPDAIETAVRTVRAVKEVPDRRMDLAERFGRETREREAHRRTGRGLAGPCGRLLHLLGGLARPGQVPSIRFLHCS